MNRQQFALVVTLGLVGFLPWAANSAAHASDWKTVADDSGGATLDGKLYRNSADQNGTSPYALVDKWGVTRGYVAAAAGVDLESSVGQQVTLQGTVRTLPGGDMPCMTCTKVMGGNGGQAAAGESAPIAALPSANATAVSEAAPRGQAVPMKEVVLEPQPAAIGDDQYQAPPAPARRPAPCRPRYTGGTAAAYQESIPAPPSGSARMMHRAPEPAADPAMEGVPAISQGRVVDEGPMMEGSMPGHVNGDCGGGCATCDGAPCGNGGPCGACCDDFDAAWAPHLPLFVIGPTGGWVKADYLLWTESGMKIPALVTTGSTADANPGALGEPGTQTLYGPGTILDEARSGFRLTAGVWMNRCCTIGFEGEYLTLQDEVSNFYMWSNGNPILARPFYDASVSPSQSAAELVAFPRPSPQGLDGSIAVNGSTRFNGAGARLLFVLCRQDGCWTDDCSCLTYHDRYRAILTLGYRYLNLDDQLGISERLTSSSGVVTQIDPNTGQPVQITPATNAFAIDDDFTTHNWFNGGEVGMKFELQRNRWGLDIFPRIGIGETHSTVNIYGQTIITDNTGAETLYPGGLLARPTNMAGSPYAKNMFSVVPELDLNLSYQLTPHAKFVVGYSFLYWTNVARAGEQINTTVNKSTLPNAPAGTMPTGDLTQPTFTFNETGFWAQGLNVGIDCRW